MIKNKSKIFILIVYIFNFLLIILTFILGSLYNIPFEKITGDPANYFKAHPFTGIISNLGALMWCTTTSICMFTGLYLYSLKYYQEARFLIYSGFISLILLLDDFFMFHDYIFYSFGSLTLEPFIFLAYALLLFHYCISSYKIILEYNYFYFGLSILLFGLSVLMDLVFLSEGYEYFIEDSLKFIGITSWMIFFTTTSFKILSKHNK